MYADTHNHSDDILLYREIFEMLKERGNSQVAILDDAGIQLNLHRNLMREEPGEFKMKDSSMAKIQDFNKRYVQDLRDSKYVEDASEVKDVKVEPAKPKIKEEAYKKRIQELKDKGGVKHITPEEFEQFKKEMGQKQPVRRRDFAIDSFFSQLEKALAVKPSNVEIHITIK